MPSMGGILRYDKYLSKIALTYPTGNLIGHLVCPTFDADQYSDAIFVDGDDAILRSNDLAEGAESNGVDFSAGTPYSFRSERHALNTVITRKEMNNVAKPVKLKSRNTRKLTNRLRLNHEQTICTALTDETIVTNYTDVDLVANGRLDESTPTLETDIVTACKAVHDDTGAIANTIVIPYEAALYAAKIAFIKDSLIYSGRGMEYVAGDYQAQTRQLFGLPPVIKGLRVIVSTGRRDDSNKGETASVGNPWGKNILIGYVPPNLDTDSMFGLVCAEHEAFRVKTGPVTDPDGEKVLVEWDYDIVQGKMECWYLLQNVIG